MVSLFTALVAAAIIAAIYLRYLKLKRADHIRTFDFPRGLLDRFAARRPTLSTRDRALVAQALRQFFLAYLKSGRKFVSMPSQLVDDLWHEFILYTRHYDAFCKQAFGRYMHHTPAVVLGSDRKLNEGLRRVWWYACREENIDPRNALRLPLLFAIDAKLNAADGFRYVADCSGVRKQDAGGPIHCGGHMSDGSIDGTTDGFGDGGSGDSGGSGDGGDGGGGGGCGGD